MIDESVRVKMITQQKEQLEGVVKLTSHYFAERLKFSAGLFALPQRAVVEKPKCEPTAIKILQTHPSIESSNTISNSSLQDLGESEFSGMELAQYMGELNVDLITWQSSV